MNVHQTATIHETATIHPTARVGAGAWVGAGARVVGAAVGSGHTVTVWTLPDGATWCKPGCLDQEPIEATFARLAAPDAIEQWDGKDAHALAAEVTAWLRWAHAHTARPQEVTA